MKYIRSTSTLWVSVAFIVVWERLNSCISPACLPLKSPRFLQVYELHPKARKIFLPFPKDLMELLQSRWIQFEAYTQWCSCIEFLPWNQQNLRSHFAWIKIFVPFFAGQRGTPEATEGRKSLQSSTEVGHVLQLLIVWEEETWDLKHGTWLFQNAWEQPKKNILRGLFNKHYL